jgi:hypothetical protein
MAKKYPKPIFKPRVLKKLFEDQWYVEAEWPDGTIEQVAGPFASDSELGIGSLTNLRHGVIERRHEPASAACLRR